MKSKFSKKLIVMRNQEIEQLAQEIRIAANLNPEGGTLRISEDLQLLELNPEMGERYIIAYDETQNQYGDEGLRVCLNHALCHDRKIGWWTNPENGQVQYDSVFTQPDEAAALTAGFENRQHSIFDLATFSEIEALGSRAFQE
jgi:fructokinase